MIEEDSTVAAVSAEVASFSLVSDNVGFDESSEFHASLLVAENTGKSSVETHVETEVPKTYDWYRLKGVGLDESWKIWRASKTVTLGLPEPVRFYDDEVFGRVLYNSSWVVPRKKPNAYTVPFEIEYDFKLHVVTGDDYILFV